MIGVTALFIFGVFATSLMPAGVVRESSPLLFTAIALLLMPALWERELDAFSPPVFSGVMQTIGLLAIAAHLYDAGTIDFADAIRLGYDDTIARTNSVWLVYLVSTVAYYAAYYGTSGRGGAIAFPRFPSTWNRSRLTMVVIVCAALFIPAYAYFQSRLGLAFDAIDPAEGKAVWREQDDKMAWFFRATDLGLLPFLLLVATLIRREKTLRIRRRLIILSLAAMGMVFLIVRMGVRGTAIYFLITLAIVIHYSWRRFPLWLMLSTGFVVIVGTTILGDLRERHQNEIHVTTAQFRPIHALSRHEEDRDRLAAAALVMETFPSRIDYLYGESFTALLVSPIPRYFWPAKSQFTKWQDNGIVFRLTGQPLPLSLPFILYVNFGWFGIAAGMALWGGFHRMLYTWLRARQHDPGVVILYAQTLLYFTPTALGFGAALGTSVPAYIALRFIGERRRRRALVAAMRTEVGVDVTAERAA